MSDDDLWTEEDDAQFFADLEEDRRAAAALVHETFPDLEDAEPPQPDLDEAAAALRDGIAGGGWTYERLGRVTGWRILPPDENIGSERGWLFAAMCALEPQDDPEDDVELESAVAALDEQDWVTIVSGLVESGPGTDASPEALIRLLQDGDRLDPDDEDIVLTAAELVIADWRALGAVDDHDRLTRLGAWGLPQALHELWCTSDDDDADLVVMQLHNARAAWEADPDEWDDDDFRAVAGLLAGIAPAPLLLDLREERGWQPFLRAVHDRVKAADAAYLLAVEAECAGDVVREQSWLERALAAESRHAPALTTAAALASCRGDATTALDLLRRAEVPGDDHEVVLLRRFAQPPASGPSRNAPCACGSGKKYKLCCGARGTAHPLTDRASWLLHKAVDFARSVPHRDVVIERAMQLSRYDEHPMALLRTLQSDQLVMDAALFEDGLLERFLDVRGALLPEDERELAGDWLRTRLAVYEVLSTRPGSSVLLRDGDDVDVEVRERTASRSLRRGDVLLTRLLPTGPGWMLGSVVGLPRTVRDRARAVKSAEELYELVAELHRPPQLTNTEGHALVLLEQEWSFSDAGWQRLVSKLEPTDDDDVWMLVRASKNIAASFRRTAEGAVVEVNSRERADEVASLVREADPSAELLAEREPAVSPLAAAPPPVPMTPEMEAALREHLESYEREWCDMSIPALGGRTPREAVRTAAGRTAVEDLLADMPDLPNGMSARRVRALLELPTPLR